MELVSRQGLNAPVFAGPVRLPLRVPEPPGGSPTASSDPAPSPRLASRRIEAYSQAASTQESRRFLPDNRSGLPLRAQQALRQYEDTESFSQRDELSSMIGIDVYA